MEFELNADGTLKLDEAGNPIPKTSSQQAPSNTNQVPAPGVGPTVTTNNPPPEFFTVISEKDGEIRRLREQLEQRNHNSQPVNNEAANQEYLTNPDAYFTKKIGEAVSNSVSGLNDFVSQTKKEQLIEGTFNQMKVHQNYAHFANQPSFLSIVKSFCMQQASITQDTVVAIANAVIGQVAMGQIPGITLPDSNQSVPPVNQNQNQNQTQPTPPYVPPSNQNQNNQNQNQPVQLTEAERRLARVSGMTDEQYKAAQSGTSRSFVNTRPAAPAPK